MHHPKADRRRMHISRKEEGQGMTNLEMTYKTTAIGLISYFQSSGDSMLQTVLQHEEKMKLHSMVKKAGSSSFSLIWIKKKLISILNRQKKVKK